MATLGVPWAVRYATSGASVGNSDAGEIYRASTFVALKLMLLGPAVTIGVL